jgi:hypothetical protein
MEDGFSPFFLFFFSFFFFVELDKLLDLNTFTFRLDLHLRPPKRELYCSNYFPEESHIIYFNRWPIIAISMIIGYSEYKTRYQTLNK